MEDLLRDIYRELVAIHEKLNSIESTIVSYSSDDHVSEILDVLKEMKKEI